MRITGLRHVSRALRARYAAGRSILRFMVSVTGITALTVSQVFTWIMNQVTGRQIAAALWIL